jgi:hypothetical protein
MSLCTMWSLSCLNRTLGVTVTDVTNAPSYGNFATVVGTWKTKSQLTLMDIDGKMYLSTRSEHYAASTRDLQVLPPGTEIRIEHLMLRSSFDIGRLYPTGSLTSGAYAGRAAEVDTRLFAPNYFEPPGSATAPSTPLEKRWDVAPEWLEK